MSSLGNCLQASISRVNLTVFGRADSTIVHISAVSPSPWLSTWLSNLPPTPGSRITFAAARSLGSTPATQCAAECASANARRAIATRMKATNRSALPSWTAHSAGPQQPCSENGFLPFHQISRHRPIVFHAYFMRPIQDESWSCNSRYTSWFARKGLKMHCVLDAQANGSYGGRNGHNRLTILAELDYGNEERRPHEVSDVILPVQYYESARRARFLCGERRLMLALLADAICCLLTVGLRYERLRQEARRWLAGRGLRRSLSKPLAKRSGWIPMRPG